jgi:ribosome-associated toxin RatA of RatAB toxin-antitoxin module
MGQATSGRRTIAAPAERILDAIADVASYPEWADGVREARVLDADESGRPSQARFEVSSGVVNGWYVVEYDWTSPTGVSWTLVESPLLRAMEGEYLLSPGDGVTDVEYRLTVDPSIPLIGPLRRKAEQHLVKTALDDLAGRVEEAS